MRNYGIGAGKDGMVVPPPNGKFASNAPAEYVQFPSGTAYENGVEPLDDYPAGWFNAIQRYYTEQWLETAATFQDLYGELLDIVRQGGLTPNAAAQPTPDSPG